jgi:DNA-directed RNA polymerase II subunit RPB1
MPLRSNTGFSQQNQYGAMVDEHLISALQMGILSPEQVSRLSVAEISSTSIYDPTTLVPNFNAINDPRMGVMDKDSRCFTCKSPMETCAGHFGHIALNAPVYHPGLLVYLVKFLRCVCFNCSRVLLNKSTDEYPETVDRLLKIKNAKLRFKALQNLVENVHVCSTEKGGCGYTQPKINKGSLKISLEIRDSNFDKTRDRKGVLWPEECLRVLQKVSDYDCKLMGLNPEYFRPEWSII